MSNLMTQIKSQAAQKSRFEKEEELKNARVNSSYESFLLAKENISKAQNLNLRSVPDGYFEKLDIQYEKARDEYKSSLPFITSKLTKLVPLYYPNLILVGALTGSGKTTASANIVHQLLKDKKKVLIISNEELVLDVYTRIACLDLDLNINERLNFTDEQHQLVRSKIPEIGEYVRVVDSEYDSNHNLTSSIEGMRILFEHISEEKCWDCIIIDYYQKVTKSQYSDSTAHHFVLQEFTLLLDKFYKICHAPVIVMCQLHPSKADDAGFESRIKLGKSILVSSTFALEIESDKTNLETKWICHKGRWGSHGIKVTTIWSKGKFFDKGGSNE
jgi:archaellum biogenesis ATPase FlaH